MVGRINNIVTYSPLPFDPSVTEYLPSLVMVVPLGKIHLDSTELKLSGKLALIAHRRELKIVICDDGCVLWCNSQL